MQKDIPALIVARVTPFGDDGPWADFKASRSRASRARRRDDELRLRPRTRRQVRPAADRAADVARVSHRRRAAHVRDPRRAALSLPHGQGPARLVRGARGGLEIHRGRSHDVGHAPRAGAAPDLPPRARVDLAEPVDRAHQGRALGDGEPRQPRGRRRAACCSSSTRYGIGAGDLSVERRRRRKADASFPAPARSTSKRDHGMEAVQRFVRAFTYENMPWREAQEAGNAVGAAAQAARERASIRTGSKRGSVTDIEHPELGESFRYATSKWISTANSLVGRAPRAAAERGRRQRSSRRPKRDAPVIGANARVDPNEPPSTRGKPFPLHGIRILDFTWFLASAGGTRFLARVRRREHQGRAEEPSRHAARRDGAGRRTRSARQGDGAAAGRDRHRHGRPVQQQESRQARHLAQRAASEGPRDREAPRRDVGHRRGRLLARRARQLGARLRRAEERSSRTSSTSSSPAWARRAPTGASAPSARSRMRSPGLSEMSGLPEPAMPAGWGYSYLDWMGAYSFALAMLSRALSPRAHRRRPVDRRVADRGRPLHQRHGDPRLVGERARLDALRQPLAVQARGAARRLSVRRRRPLDHDRVLHRSGVAGALQSRRASGVGEGSALRDARRAPRAPGRARCS